MSTESILFSELITDVDYFGFENTGTYTALQRMLDPECHPGFGLDIPEDFTDTVSPLIYKNAVSRFTNMIKHMFDFGVDDFSEIYAKFRADQPDNESLWMNLPMAMSALVVGHSRFENDFADWLSVSTTNFARINKFKNSITGIELRKVVEESFSETKPIVFITKALFAEKVGGDKKEADILWRNMPVFFENQIRVYKGQSWHLPTFAVLKIHELQRFFDEIDEPQTEQIDKGNVIMKIEAPIGYILSNMCTNINTAQINPDLLTILTDLHMESSIYFKQYVEEEMLNDFAPSVLSNLFIDISEGLKLVTGKGMCVKIDSTSNMVECVAMDNLHRNATPELLAILIENEVSLKDLSALQQVMKPVDTDAVIRNIALAKDLLDRCSGMDTDSEYALIDVTNRKIFPNFSARVLCEKFPKYCVSISGSKGDSLLLVRYRRFRALVGSIDVAYLQPNTSVNLNASAAAPLRSMSQFICDGVPMPPTHPIYQAIRDYTVSRMNNVPTYIRDHWYNVGIHEVANKLLLNNPCVTVTYPSIIQAVDEYMSGMVMRFAKVHSTRGEVIINCTRLSFESIKHQLSRNRYVQSKVAHIYKQHWETVGIHAVTATIYDMAKLTDSCIFEATSVVEKYFNDTYPADHKDAVPDSDGAPDNFDQSSASSPFSHTTLYRKIYQTVFTFGENVDISPADRDHWNRIGLNEILQTILQMNPLQAISDCVIADLVRKYFWKHYTVNLVDVQGPPEQIVVDEKHLNIDTIIQQLRHSNHVAVMLSKLPIACRKRWIDKDIYTVASMIYAATETMINNHKFTITPIVQKYFSGTYGDGYDEQAPISDYSLQCEVSELPEDTKCIGCGFGDILKDAVSLLKKYPGSTMCAEKDGTVVIKLVS